MRRPVHKTSARRHFFLLRLVLFHHKKIRWSISVASTEGASYGRATCRRCFGASPSERRWTVVSAGRGMSQPHGSRLAARQTGRADVVLRRSFFPDRRLRCALRNAGITYQNHTTVISRFLGINYRAKWSKLINLVVFS